LLEAVAGNARITQRALASRLGIAVGLTNICLKRLARRGLIEFVNVGSNRIVYMVTKQGVAEKSRLTYELMEHSLQTYGQVRQQLRQMLEPCVRHGTRVAIYGAGEAAEVAYLALRELGVEPVAVYGGPANALFLGAPARRVTGADHDLYDVLIVATLSQGTTIIDELIRVGIPHAKLLPLRPWPATEVTR
jgi:predicted transcriptional regulator